MNMNICTIYENANVKGDNRYSVKDAFVWTLLLMLLMRVLTAYQKCFGL